MLLEDVLSEKDFDFACCKFLETFWHCDDKTSLIEKEPSCDSSNPNACVLAAIVHFLANQVGITVPAWVNGAKYFSPVPVYAFDTKNPEYQEFLRKTSPKEFADRNIFCGENPVGRV